MITDNFNVTLDYYDISISDRIVISNRVPFGTSGEVEFFTNSIDSKTTGLDLVVDYKNMVLGSGMLGFLIAGNVNLKNEHEGEIPQVGGIDVIDSTQLALFFTSRPSEKFVAGVTYDISSLHLSLNATYFGSTEFRQTGMSTNLKTVFDPKVVTDIGVSYDIFSNLIVSANVNNIFDVLPKWNFEAVNSLGEAILADPAQVKVQTNLVTFNGRYDVMTYDGYHFSQLGRLFNLALTFRF